MQKTLIVSIVSKETVPNVQFAKWYRMENPDLNADLLFISTQQMEKKEKSKLILDSLNCSDFPYDLYGTIEVEENNIVNIKKELEEVFNSDDTNFDAGAYEKIILNMTGGTKIMSLAAFQFFSKFSNTEIYYQSFNQDIFQLYPVEKPITTKASVNLVEVLVANGFEAEETGDLLKDYEFNKSFYSKCLKENNSGLKVIADVGNVKDANGNFNLSKMYNAPGYFYNSDVDKAINIVKFCGFNPESLTGEQISYITGGWFEEYVFQFIMNTYKIPEGNIALNMKIERNNDKNELDVVYITSDNKIHIIECKALVKKNDNTKVISDAIYKLKSLTTKFGLKVQGHIYTKAKEINQMYRDRADDLGIEIVDGTLI